MPFRLLKLGSIVVPLLLIVLITHLSWQREHSRAQERALQNAELIASYMQRVIDVQQTLLDRVGDTIADQGEEMDVRILHERLLQIDLKFDYTLTVGVALPDGRLITSNPKVPVVHNVKDRAYFRHFEGDGSQLFVDRLTLQPSGRDALVMASRLGSEAFRGVAVSTTPVPALRDFLWRIRTGQNSAASIVRADGKILIRHVPGAGPTQLPLDAPVMRAMAAGGGVYEVTAVTDNVTRLYATARVGSSELFANYGLDKNAIRFAWLSGVGPLSLLLLFAGLLGLAVTHQAEQRILADKARSQAEFDRRLLAEAEQRATMQTALLQEMHHRIKNNLQIVSSLIAHTGDTRATQAVGARIQAIASINDMLYQAADGNQLDLAKLLEQLLNNPALVPPERGVSTTVRADSCTISAERAVPVAVAVSELVVNSVKHAFLDKAGRISVSLIRSGPHVTLTVEDNGTGMAVSPDGRRSGLKLVNVLVRQMGGTIEFADALTGSSRGTKATIRFQIDSIVKNTRPANVGA
jgi:two-component sensor histidine kinase